MTLAPVHIPSVRPSGPPDAKIMVVGEAPGEQEIAKGEPFVGASGHELTKMLHEAGISRSECFLTNVCRIRPPGNDISLFFAKAKKDRTAAHVEVKGKWTLPPIVDGIAQLQKEIALVKPKVIIALGNVPMWALTGRWGVTDWRGSLLEYGVATVIPTYHPAAILRNWAWRAIAVHDLKRARGVLEHGVKWPDYSHIIHPSFDRILEIITTLKAKADLAPTKLAVDIETRLGHITCIGFAWSKTEAICIPLWQTGEDPHYWMEEEESEITIALHSLLTHPNIKVIGQNFIYDTQYIYRHWHFIPNFSFDTMLAQHTAFAGMPKSLDFLASMYAESYRYWKQDVSHSQIGKVDA